MSKKHNKKRRSGLKECTLFVDGMHCASCELLIEKKLLKKAGVESVEASLSGGEVHMVYSGKRPDLGSINKEFNDRGYSFSDKKFKKDHKPLISFKENGQMLLNKTKAKDFLVTFIALVVLIIGFVLIEKSQIAALINVNQSSSLFAFFLFGLIAGTSTCAALIGGLLLSMAKNWHEVYIAEDSIWKKSQPFMMFNVGRLISFPILGGVLGLIGGAFQISVSLTAIITIAVSLMMFMLALQMLDVEWAYKFQFRSPKFLTRFAADEDNFKGKYMPFIVGALTFFLPCGFTIVAQGLALSSGSFVTGALVMFMFALGTLPMLSLISYSSVKFNEKPHFTAQFNKIAGLLVLFFALYNFNAQLNVLGLPSLSDLKFSRSEDSVQAEGNKNLPEVVDGKQILKMDASSRGYKPNYLVVKAGIPVKWEIDDVGTTGCTSGIISNDLKINPIELKRGKNYAEFTAETPGKYKFSCWMGMFSGTIEAI